MHGTHITTPSMASDGRAKSSAPLNFTVGLKESHAILIRRQKNSPTLQTQAYLNLPFLVTSKTHRGALSTMR